jgi:PAS domain S-box-containing protein
MSPAACELSHQEYAQLVEQAPILVWRSGLDGLCDYFNARWLAFTGRGLAQELGNGWLEGVHPDDKGFCADIYLTHFEARSPFEMEYRLRRHDGAWRWIFDRGGPFFRNNGSFGGFIGSCVDVTARVEAEAALAEAHEAQLHTLRGLLPICMTCKKIRNDQGYWQELETYITEHSAADFSHGLCPECKENYRSQLREELQARKG